MGFLLTRLILLLLLQGLFCSVVHPIILVYLRIAFVRKANKLEY